MRRQKEECESEKCSNNGCHKEWLSPCPTLPPFWGISWDSLAKPKGKFQVGRSELMEVCTGIPEEETFVSSFSTSATEL